MKDINIAKMIVQKRREKGITQEDLANYIGVSKASVSKWETGQSYPDITFLPQLASYFNVSIDDLIGYEPQMTEEDIRHLYHNLASKFATSPYDEVLEECHGIIKKYFSCFPLLIQMGILFFNMSVSVGTDEKKKDLIEDAKDLFHRVRMESTDIDLQNQALYFEAACYLSLGNPNDALVLLENTNTVKFSPELLLSQAYQMTGNIHKAKVTLQVGIYQNLMSIFSVIPTYIMQCIGNPEEFEEVYERTRKIIDTFQVEKLHPSILLTFYIMAASGYATLGNNDKALNLITDYANIATTMEFPMRIHGDSFFNYLDEWFKETDLDLKPPRDERDIKKSIVEALTNNPSFASISNSPKFIEITEKLKNKL